MKYFCIFFALLSTASAAVFLVKNNYPDTIWVGILGNGGKAPLANGGFALKPKESRGLLSNNNWAGRFWARTGCDSKTQHCQTGDCGNKLECKGAGGVPPVTLVEITLNGAGGKDFYDISLVDGFNIKASIAPVAGTGACKTSSCETDINNRCPDELKQKDNRGRTIACYSACTKWNQDIYCCRNAYGSPKTCNPKGWSRNYAKFFKDACPRAYSFAYDDPSSTFTCKSNRYVITFG